MRSTSNFGCGNKRISQSYRQYFGHIVRRTNTLETLHDRRQGHHPDGWTRCNLCTKPYYTRQAWQAQVKRINTYKLTTSWRGQRTEKEEFIFSVLPCHSDYDTGLHRVSKYEFWVTGILFILWIEGRSSVDTFIISEVTLTVQGDTRCIGLHLDLCVNSKKYEYTRACVNTTDSTKPANLQ